MSTAVRSFLFLFVGLIMALGTANFATASGGSGGGGGGSSSGGGGNSGGIGRHGGSFNLSYSQVGPTVGTRSSCIGGYNLTTYVTTLSLDWKCTSLPFDDGTEIDTLVFTIDYFNGTPWPVLDAGSTTVSGGKAILRNPNVVTTGINGLPVMQSVVLTLADGTPIFVGVPNG